MRSSLYGYIWFFKGPPLMVASIMFYGGQRLHKNPIEATIYCVYQGLPLLMVASIGFYGGQRPN